MKLTLWILGLLSLVTGTFTLDDGFDLSDALGPDPTTAKPTAPPKKSGFDDSDLLDVSGGDYKPDGGKAGGHAPPPAHDPHGAADQPQADSDLLWGQILKMLNANMPEEFYSWMFNLKQMLTPLLERVMDLLQALQ